MEEEMKHNSYFWH